MDLMGMKAVLLLFVYGAGTAIAFQYDCPIRMERVGCYRDSVVDRAMPVQMMNAKDVDSLAYSGSLVDWFNYANFLEEFMCSCAMKAYNLGYKVIGLQFYAECWSSQKGHIDFDRHGQVHYCVNGDYSPCEDGDMVCMGKHQANFIYRIAPTHCDTYYQPLGCHTDLGFTPRPLLNYAMNERDYSIPNWNGRLIDWKYWNDYSPLMICRCAEEATRIGHKYFSIQFYGECWTSPTKDTLNRDGTSNRCVAAGFNPPNFNSFIAVGKDHANYAYELTTGPNP